MIKTIDNALENISKWGTVLCVLLMLLLTVMNIVLRWFEVSLLWVEPLVRHLVFIAAFFGGSLATSHNHHIKIDLLARVLEHSKNEALKLWLERLLLLVTLIATSVLCYSSINLSKVEFEFGKEVFFNIHSGYLVSIIPFGMGLISLRLLFRILLSFGKAEVKEGV